MSENPFPLVSVVTPTYNCANYLSETIESVLAQNYPHMEYIVLDDGSTDNTRAVLERYNERIIWETHANMGEQRTVNKAWAMTKGEFIITVSADDPILPGLIRTGVEFMLARPTALVGYPGWRIIDEHSRVIREPAMFEYNYLHMLLWQHCFPGPGTLMRRKVLELEPGGRDASYRYIGDFEFWLRVGLHGPFVYIPYVLATWRTHSGGATSRALQNNPTKAAEHIRAVKTLYTRPELPDAAHRARSKVFATAHYVAGIRCLPQHRSRARRYFLQSLRYTPFKPLKYPGGHSRSWFLMIETILLPGFLRRALQFVWRFLKAKTQGEST
jgi:glycosyltransferase involved in cell wall biosynthesis